MSGRLAHLPTLRIDPDKPIAFTYRNREYQGYSGDSVATALYASGVRVFSRSLKYHRPRGLYSLDGESETCTMAVDGIPNVQAEKKLLKSHLRVAAQNVIGSADWDLLGFLDGFDWAMPAGFYYKIMHKPAWIWPLASRFLRRMAGVGHLSPSFQMQGRFDEIYPTVDVCVVGGGPAGMSAALAAAEQGLRVMLLEARPWLGGIYDHRVMSAGTGTALYERARDLSTRVDEAPNLRVLRHASLMGVYNNNLITAFQVGTASDVFDERYIEIRASTMVVATGCIERPLLFENNERPGVMQVGCAHRLARTYGILPGSRAVFSVGHDLGLEAALDLANLRLPVAAVADTRANGQDPALVDALSKKGIPFHMGWVAAAAHGRKAVRGVTLAEINGTARQDLACDLLVASAGMSPVTGPLTMAGAKLAFDARTGYFLAARVPERVHAAGRLLGLEDPESIETSGRLAGLRAAADCGAPVRSHIDETQRVLEACPGPVEGSTLIRGPGTGRKAFLDFDEDTPLKNVKQAYDMGFDVPELSKRFANVGTGPSQGGIPGHNFPLVLSEHRAEAPGSLNPTTVRAPMVPAYVATFAGAHHDVHKCTPLHDSQLRAGGIMRRVGVWKRARYFSEDTSCKAEIENVRSNVGIIDVSTLGKFRIFGPDAEKALQRVYIGNMAKVPHGKLKYAAMCNDDGCIVDDGVITKQRENDYYLTTSSARAGATIEWIRYHTRYDGWDYHIVNLTDALSAINIAGPNSRRVLEKVTAADVSNEAFPFMGYREITVGRGIPARVCRIGFVGELSYELHVPASYAQAVWNLLIEAGRDLGIRPFGMEAQSCMRLEKGHLIVNLESEIRTTLLDLGMGFLWYRRKPEARTVGAVALTQTQNQPDRYKLVGLEPKNPRQTPGDGSVIVDSTIRGHVCTARYSFSLEKSIGLALVEEPLARVGTRLEIFQDDWGKERLAATVVKPPFYDPAGERLRM